ncbi:MAG: hypothetical protein U9R44_07980 [Candidatus Omnitrophota bacterium]|nr:hypothetical protein [Candidatus Omnitrophota bacterium]
MEKKWIQEGTVMKNKSLFRAETSKPIREFIEDVKKNAPQFGFRVHEVVNMRELYEGYAIEVAADFEVYSITLCSPQKSYKSITKNPERNAVIVEQKQIIVYNNNGITTINYLPLPEEFVKEVFPDDEQFPGSLHESCLKRIQIIKVSL